MLNDCGIKKLQIQTFPNSLGLIRLLHRIGLEKRRLNLLHSDENSFFTSSGLRL